VAVDNYQDINATAIREAYFAAEAAEAPLADSLRRLLPENVQQALQAFRQSDAYREICEEQAFVARYRAGWANAPYPPTFVTVDAVVVQSGHVLLVERKARPGKGLARRVRPPARAPGRGLPHAFYIELEPDKVLPRVKGGDDARHAQWVPLAELDPGRLYEDHYFIIQEMIGA